MGPASSSAIAKLTLPAWLTAALPTGCTLAGQTVTCRVLGLRAVDDVHPFTIPLTASATPSANGNLVAQVETHEFDPDTADNQVTVQAASAVRADLWVTPVAGPRTAVRSGAVTLAVMASNTGPALAANTRVTMPPTWPLATMPEARPSPSVIHLRRVAAVQAGEAVVVAVAGSTGWRWRCWARSAGAA